MITQSIVAVPMIGLYGLGILIALVVGRNKERRRRAGVRDAGRLGSWNTAKRPALVGLTGTNGAGKGEVAAYLGPEGLRLPLALRRPPGGAGRPGPRGEPRQPHRHRQRAPGPVRPRRPRPPDDGQGPRPDRHRQHPEPPRGGIPEAAGRVRSHRRRRARRGPVRPDAGPRPRRIGRDARGVPGEGRAWRWPASETGQQLARCMAMADRTHPERRDARGAVAESGGGPMTRARVSKDDYYLGIAGEVAKRSTCFRRVHRGHHRPRRPDRLDGVRRRPAQDQGQPDPRLLPPGPARHPPRPALRALPERPRRAERHHQRRPGGRQPSRRRHVHLRHRSRRRTSAIDAFPCFICKKMIINCGLRRVVCSTESGRRERLHHRGLDQGLAGIGHHRRHASVREEERRLSGAGAGPRLERPRPNPE